MSERYSRLFALPNDLYATGSPVVIAAGALLKDNQTGKVLAQLKLRSISSKQIKAVKVCITSMDTVGRTLGEAVEHQYLDLNISRDAEFGQKAAIALPDSSTRSFSATIEEVAFADNTIWTSSNASWQPLPRPTQLASEIQDGELVKQYQLTYGKQCQFSPLSHDDLWFCSCGAVNRAEEGACHSCHLEYTRLISVQWDALKEAAAVRLAEEKAYAEKQAAERAKREAEAKVEEEKQQAIAQQKAKKTKRIIAICAAVGVVLCVAVGVVTQIIIPEQQRKAAYEAAMTSYSTGDYEDAVAKFTALGDYNDSANKVLESKYNLASAAFDSEDYAKAETQFLELDAYLDSAQRAKDSAELLETHTAYKEALSSFNKRDYVAAISAFRKLGNYKDSEVWLESAQIAQKEASYNEALAALAAGEYENAKYRFQSLNGYKDSAAKAEEAQNAHLESLYQKALTALRGKNYKDAYQQFYSLGDYKDCAEKRLTCIKASLRSAKKGSTAIFGSTEWEVLQIKNNSYTLITNSDQSYDNFAAFFTGNRSDAEMALITKGPYLPSKQDVKSYSLSTLHGLNTSMMLSDGWLWLGNVIDTPSQVGYRPLSYFMLNVTITD